MARTPAAESAREPVLRRRALIPAVEGDARRPVGGDARHRRLRPSAPLVRVPRARLPRHPRADIGSQGLGRAAPRAVPGAHELGRTTSRSCSPKNRGGAWGLLQSTSENVRRPFFLLVSVAAIAFIMTLYRRLQPRQRALKWGLPLVLGGALGNVFDRIRYGHVIDFIDYRADWMRKLNEVLFALAERPLADVQHRRRGHLRRRRAHGGRHVHRASAGRPRTVLHAPAPCRPPQSGEPRALGGRVEPHSRVAALRPRARPSRPRRLPPATRPSTRPPAEAPCRRSRKRSRAPGALPALRRRLPVVLRPPALGLPLRDRGRRALGAAHRREPRRHRRSRARDAARGRGRRAHPARPRRRLLLGLRAPLHRSRRRSTGRSTRRSASRAAYDGVWDAAKSVCHPRRPTASPGRSSGPAGSRTTAASSAPSRRRVVPPAARPLPVLEGGGHGGLRRAARPRLRAHGLPAGGLLLRRDVRAALGHLVPAGGARRARQSSRRTRSPHVAAVEPTRCIPRRSTSRRRRSRSRRSACCGVHPRKRYDGQVFAAFLALYAVARFLLEYLRRDDRGGLLGLSTSQLIGVALVAAAAALHARCAPRPCRPPP